MDKNIDTITKANEVMDKIEQACNAKLTELNNRIALLEGCIEKAQGEHDEAEAEATKAVDALQMDTFHDAQKRAIAAAEEVSLCKAKIEELKKTPLITKEEYKGYITEIDAALDIMNMTERGKFAEIIKAELIPVGDATSGAIIRANKLYEFMIRDMLQIKDITKPAYHNVKHSYNDFGIHHMVNNIKESPVFRKACSEAEDEGAATLRPWA